MVYIKYLFNFSVLELLSGGQLFDRLVSSPTELDEIDVGRLMWQICEA